jgi:hypothetical protein
MDHLDRPALTAGARITWTHFTVTGSRIERSGTVWDRGPAVDGALVVCWVIPDDPLPGDLYAAVPVGKATRRQPANGTCATNGPWARKYELFSSDSPASALGCLAVTAARCSQHQREAVTG